MHPGDTSEHSPTPWEIGESISFFPTWLVIDAKGENVADCEAGPTGKARAESIVRCANSHDALVEALRNIGDIEPDDVLVGLILAQALAGAALAQLEDE